VASAGPHASMHLAPDRQPRQHPTTQFFTGRMPFLPPTNSVKALKNTTVYITDFCIQNRDVLQSVFSIPHRHSAIGNVSVPKNYNK